MNNKVLKQMGIDAVKVTPVAVGVILLLYGIGALATKVNPQLSEGGVVSLIGVGYVIVLFSIFFGGIIAVIVYTWYDLAKERVEAGEHND